MKQINEYEFVQAWTSGMTVAYIKEKFNIKMWYVYRLVHHLNLPLRDINIKRKYYPDLIHFREMDEIGRYWLGFIYADGYIGKPNGKIPKRTTITLQERDTQHLIKLADDVKLPRDVVKHKINKTGFSYLSKNKGKQCTISINSTELASILGKYGIDARSKSDYKQHIPKFSKLQDYHAYLRGLIDGDGSIYFSNGQKKIKGISIYPFSCKKKLIVSIAITYKPYGEEIQEIIKKMIPGNVTLYKQKNIWYVAIHSCNAERLLDLLYGNNPSRYLDRKYETYKDWKQYLMTRPKNPYQYMCKVRSRSDINKFKRMWLSGVHEREILKKFGIKSTTVQRVVNKLKLLPRTLNNRGKFDADPMVRTLRGSVDQKEFKTMWMRGDKMKDIKKKLNLGTSNDLWHVIKRLDLPVRSKANAHLFNHMPNNNLDVRKINKTNQDKFKQMWMSGVRKHDIETEFGISRTAIESALDRMGLPYRTKSNRHLFNLHRVKDIEGFKQMWCGGCKRRDIMNKFGIGQSEVTRTAVRLNLPLRMHRNHA